MDASTMGIVRLASLSTSLGLYFQSDSQSVSQSISELPGQPIMQNYRFGSAMIHLAHSIYILYT